MSNTVINLDLNVSSNSGGQKKKHNNAKHRQFLGKKNYLKQKGSFKKKQNANELQHVETHSHKQKDVDHSQTGAVFPKFTTSQPAVCTCSSSSLQNYHEESIKESTVPSKLIKFCPLKLPSVDRSLKYVAIDCEMVGTGPKGHCSELARCSIVSYNGDVIYDKFISPVKPVTDLRTRWSGVRWQDLRNATPFKQARKEILKILSGKVVVGHAVQNDFKVLHYSHPSCLIRDTSHIPILNKKAGLPEKQTASLKKLSKILLSKDIQVGRKGHSSVEDAKATMELYKVVEVEWENILGSTSASLIKEKCF